jgi:hypothetical protein
MMKKSALLVALSAASLASGIAFAQTQPQTTKPYGAEPKPEATRPAAGDTGFSLTQFDRNKDGAVDKQEARSSASLSAVFDKADTNKDGKLDSAELSAAARLKP